MARAGEGQGPEERDIAFVRIRKDTQSALSGADVWGELREERKAFR